MIRRRMTAPLAAALLGLGMLVAVGGETEAEEAATGTVVVQMTGFRSDAGKVWVLLFNHRKGYPRDPSKAIAKRSGRIENGKATISFKGMPHGTYAASVHHDEDNDLKMRKNWIGMPKEGIGASNNPRSVGPPSFKAASFELDGERAVAKVRLRYL